MKVKNIIIFNNMNVAVFDEDGQQMGRLQKSACELIAEHCEREGFDIEGVVIETPAANWRMRRTEYGWNRDLAEDPQFTPEDVT